MVVWAKELWAEELGGRAGNQEFTSQTFKAYENTGCRLKQGMGLDMALLLTQTSMQH